MNKSTVLLISLVVVLILFSSEIQGITGQAFSNIFGRIRVPWTSIQCSDSDGLNYNTAGTVILKYLDKYGKEISRKTYTDGCTWVRDVGNTGVITEYYCSNNKLASMEYKCPYSCKDGACVQAPTPQPTCTDSDNGKNYNVRGNVYGLCKDCKPPIVGSNTDHCVDANNLREFYCTDSNGWVREVVNCPNGCKDGACIPKIAIIEFALADTQYSDDTGFNKTYLELVNEPSGYSIQKAADGTLLKFQSLYIIDDYFKKEYKRITGKDLISFSIETFGPFIMKEKPPQRWVTDDSLLLKDYFIRGAIENNIDIGKYGLVVFIFFDDRQHGTNFSDIAFWSTIYSDTQFKLAFVRFTTENFGMIDNDILTIIHEVFHLLGAHDTYEWSPTSGAGPCKDPEGIPDPNKIPKYPQNKACLMCGYVRISAGNEVRMPDFDEVVVCENEAKAIGWVDN